MRHFHCIFLFSILLSASISAQYRVSGTFTEESQPARVDRVLIFEDLSATDAFIEYTGSGVARWCDLNGNTIQQGQGAETLYPAHNTGYKLYEGSSLVASFFVLDYETIKPVLSGELPTADMFCDESVINADILVPAMSYTDTLGAAHTINRTARICYTTLSWNGTAWQDSAVCETVNLRQGTTRQQLTVPAPFTNTSFTLLFDSQYFGSAISLPDSVETAQYDAVAVTSHPSSITTSRDYNGKGAENEPQRPIDETTLSGSAPLEINFLSNGNKPVAKYYHWRILKGSTVIADRFDEEQRYTFTENGNYQVLVWVYNDSCITDSTVFDISVSESLLKVPNVFTPNGDGMNDEFRVVYRSLAEFHCWVYNRWGKLVYQWTDPAKGWDGTINGVPAAEGAYFYVIRARGTDADPKNKYHKVTKKRPADIGVYQLSGSINLIRGKK